MTEYRPGWDHFLEAQAPPWLREFVRNETSAVDADLALPMGGKGVCLPTVIAWRRHFEAAGIRVEQQGRGLDNRAGRWTGGYLAVDGEEPRDHHWLAVWPELTLFDPTWGDQDFGQEELPNLDRYLVGGMAFPDWRAAIFAG
ncbi:MAG: hypothetical protein WD830_08175 [Chloroflexota bacterium]